MKFDLIRIAVVTAALAACTFGAGPTSRPADPWVFRSVLDNHPRMITIALHKDLWLAFDAQNCSFRKAWAGGVKLTGSVYDTKHGPQPSSVGNAYFEPGSPAKVTQADQAIDATIVYRGYEIANDGVTLKYDVVTPDMTASIEDSPTYVESGRIFERRIKVRGLRPNHALELKSLDAKTIRITQDGETVVRTELPKAEQ